MDDVAHPYRDTWQTMIGQGCVDRADRWTNRKLTHGSYDDVWEGATWPRHGLPHGTHWLARCSFEKICGSPPESNRRALIRASDLAGSSLPTRPPLEIFSRRVLLIYKFVNV